MRRMSEQHDLAAPRGFRASGASRLLMILVAADVVFIILHFLMLTPLVENELFAVSRDFGYAEAFQYIKEFWIAGLLSLVALRTRGLGYIVWAMLFVYLLFDDAVMIHERLGASLADAFSFDSAFGLRPVDFGEAAVSLGVGLMFFAGVLYFYVRGSTAFRRTAVRLFLLVLAVAFFGVVVDLMDVAIRLGQSVRFILGVVEDGGEMISMSAAVSYAFFLQGTVVRNQAAGTHRDTAES